MFENVIESRHNYFRVSIIVSSLVMIAFALGLWFIPDRSTRGIFSDIVSPVIEILVTLILLFVSIRIKAYSKLLAWIWGLFCLASFSYVLGELSWAIQQDILHRSAFPSISDAFYLLSYPLLFIGIVLVPIEKYSFRHLVNRILDMAIILLVAILGFWNFLIAPEISTASSSTLSLSRVILIAYPIGDLMLLGMLIIVLYAHSSSVPRVCLGILLLGTAVSIFLDSVYDYETLAGTYFSGNILDAGFILAMLLLALAGIYQYQMMIESGQANSDKERKESRWFTLLGTIIPSLALVLAYLLLIYSHYVPLKMHFIEMSIFIGILFILVLFRYWLTLLENIQLNISLQKSLQVTQEQAHTLEDTVQKLEVEILNNKKIEEELSFDALHDRLTGLSNRSLFMDRINRIIEYNQRGASFPFSVLFMDLDSFKAINDSMGHNSGDQLLILVAQRLQKILRASDTIARLGGDEFVVLLENTDGKLSSLNVAQKIKNELNYPFQLEKGQVYVTASIGIVPDINYYKISEDVLRDADIAMYRAKAEGKDRFVLFEESMLHGAITRMDLVNNLFQAIDGKQFLAYYQPIFAVEKKNITGFEALARWNHPQRGLLMPDDFWDVAEGSGLVVSIDEWILNEACQQMKKWQDQFPVLNDLTISVNISAKTLSVPDFVEKVMRALSNSGLKNQSLSLEISENGLIKYFPIANEVFRELDHYGVQIQIDDFGSGYSSFSYLQNFPIKAMKIDRSFIAEMERTRRSQELVSSMIIMSQKLGIDCIAEGIETQEQLEKLNQMKCPYGQGFLVSQPLPHEEIETWLAKGKLF